MSKTAKLPSPISKPSPLPSLSDIFRGDKNLAWQILDAECGIYTESEVNLDSITHLAALYMRIIETLNGLQDKREAYFSSKMQKLMREPFITRCFNQQVDNRKDALENRRKELEQRVEQESQRHGHKRVLEQAIRAQEMKEQTVRDKIKTIEAESNQKLQERIRKRNEMREQRLTMSPKRARERSWEYSQRTISSGQRSFDINSYSTQFELKIDEDNSIFRTLKREVAAEDQWEAAQHKLREKQKQP